MKDTTLAFGLVASVDIFVGKHQLMVHFDMSKERQIIVRTPQLPLYVKSVAKQRAIQKQCLKYFLQTVLLRVSETI